jgi:hypothetical protein
MVGLSLEPDAGSGLGEVLDLRQLSKGVVDIFEESFLELFILFFKRDVPHLKLGILLLVALDFLPELFFLSLLVSNGPGLFSDFLFGLGEVDMEHFDDCLIFVFVSEEFVDICLEASDLGIAFLQLSFECLFVKSQLSEVGGLGLVL